MQIQMVKMPQLQIFKVNLKYTCYYVPYIESDAFQFVGMHEGIVVMHEGSVVMHEGSVVMHEGSVVVHESSVVMHGVVW